MAVVQLLSRVPFCNPMDCSTPGIPDLYHLLELAQTHVHWVLNAIQQSHSLSSLLPPAFNLSSIRVFSNESALHISSIQSLSRIQLFATPWITACEASLSITNSRSLPKLMSIESLMPSNHPILCHPLLLLPSIFPSIRVFSSESALRIRWPKYWSFSFNISPSNEHPGLMFFRMDWLDLLEVQGTLNILQHHSSKASIIWYSAFFIVQLSHPYRWPKYWSFSFSISPSNEYSGLISFRVDFELLVVPGTLKSLLQHHGSTTSILPCSTFFMVRLSHQYMTTGKTIALTIQTFVGKVIDNVTNNNKKPFLFSTSIRVWVVRVRWSKMDLAWK